MKFKTYNSHEQLNVTQIDFDSWPWIVSSLNNGCVDRTINVNALAGLYIYAWEAKRNGIITTGIDTCYVEPGGNNLIEMFW